MCDLMTWYDPQDQVSSLQRDLEACESVLRLGARDDTTADSGVQSAMTPAAAHSTPVSRLVSHPPRAVRAEEHMGVALG